MTSGTPEYAAQERGKLRRFGITVGIAFCVLASLLLWKAKPTWPYFGSLGGLFLILGLVVPVGLRPVERVWMKVAGWMGWVMTRVILGIVFLVLFTPAGLVLRLLRKDPLELRIKPEAQTYWHRREDSDRSPERMERMF